MNVNTFDFEQSIYMANAKENIKKLIEDLRQYLHKPSRDAT